MAADLLLLAALAMAEPATPPTQAEIDATLFDASVGCAAYHVYSVTMAFPESDEAKQSEEKAIMFLMASYAKMPQDKPQEAEAKIEATVQGLFEDAATLDSEKHKKEMAELAQACLAFEPQAKAIVDAAEPSPEGQ